MGTGLGVPWSAFTFFARRGALVSNLVINGSPEEVPDEATVTLGAARTVERARAHAAAGRLAFTSAQSAATSPFTKPKCARFLSACTDAGHAQSRRWRGKTAAPARRGFNIIVIIITRHHHHHPHHHNNHHLQGEGSSRAEPARVNKSHESRERASWRAWARRWRGDGAIVLAFGAWPSLRSHALSFKRGG